MSVLRATAAALLGAVVLAVAGPGAAATVEARRQMVVAAHPLAADAGIAVLREGGSALDAAIAAQMVLTLVEPQSSGIGGGAFLVHRSGTTGELTVHDGRETAPAAVTPDLFLDESGAPLPFPEAVLGGRSVGVPGVLRMLEAAHREHGRLPWARLFQPAIALAEAGFPVSPRLAGTIASAEGLRTFAATAAYFFDTNGEPIAAGTILRNPELAGVLRLLAAEGAQPFYAGALAREIVAAVAGAAVNPGRLQAADMAGYSPRRPEPVCAAYRGWRICGPPPPSSGPLAVLQTLRMLESFDMPTLGPWSAAAAHLFAEASRLAFADRNRYVADPEFVTVPVAAMLDPVYLARRARLIRPDRAMGKAEAGEPSQRRAALPAADAMDRPPSTSHLSIVDARGDIVSMTTTIESGFGSRLMVRGFLLNNELTDFSFRPQVEGAPVANRVEPGKRPRSSMAPVIAFDRDGRPALVLGSPGGAHIINYVAKVLIGVIDWGLPLDAAIAAPNLSNRNGPTWIEPAGAALAPGLRELGHAVRIEPLPSGVNAIRILPDGGLRGAADPRREGAVRAD